MNLPKPGKVLLGAMLIIGCAWVVMAVGFNYGGVDPGIIAPFVGNPDQILHGQIWRLVTPALIHTWSGHAAPSHILTTLLGLYFLAPSLEDRWGSRRMVTFLLGSIAFAYACEVLAGLIVPQLKQELFYGGLGMIEAIAVAWALQNRDQTVNLFFVLPITGTMLLGFIFLMSVLNVLANAHPAEGLVTPFGGMLAGYVLGDSSPLRAFYLKLKLRRLKAQTEAMRRAPPKHRAGGPALRVIHGTKEPPKDKRYLN